MAKSTFQTVNNVAVAPVARADSKDFVSSAIAASATSVNWNDAIPVITNTLKRTLSVVAGNQVVAAAGDGIVATPGFDLADSEIKYSYIKLDRLVTLRLYIKLSTAAKINTLTKDPSSYFPVGQSGDTVLLLPYPMSAEPASYQFSIYRYTYTTALSAGVYRHGNQSAYFTAPRLAANATVFPINIWDLIAGSPAYDASYPQAVWWSTDDIYDLQLEYETDL